MKFQSPGILLFYLRRQSSTAIKSYRIKTVNRAEKKGYKEKNTALKSPLLMNTEEVLRV